MKIKKRYKTIIAIVVLLVAIRVSMPFFIVKYVNKVLNETEGYRGSISDVDLSLYRGAYQIKDLRMDQVTNEVAEPFINIPLTDLSVEWNALFKGAIVGEIEMQSPKLNFAFSSDSTSSQTGEEVDWTQLIKDLLPIDINRFTATNGEIALIGLNAEPRMDMSFKEVDLSITNIRNVEDKDKALPSEIHATGKAPDYSGNLQFDAKANLLKLVPDMDYNASFENVDLTSLNEMVEYYSGIDFEGGTLDLYSEMVIKDSKIDGYVKPLVKDMKIFKWREKDRSLGQFFKELIAGAASEVLENHKLDQFATKVPLTGTIEATETVVWPTVINVIRNAYFGAFKKQIDNTVEYVDNLGEGEVVEGDAEREAARAEQRAAAEEEKKKK